MKNTTTTHEEEHMGTAKDVDNSILDVCVKNTIITHKEEYMGTKKDVDNISSDKS